MNPANIHSSTEQESNWINDQIDLFNIAQTGLKGQSEIFINYNIKENDAIIAGINACLYLAEVLYVGVLFVDEKFRHKGFGRILLQKAENEAKAKGAKLSHLHTFDFQAKDFYIKQGYEIFGELENCPAPYKHYYMKKVL